MSIISNHLPTDELQALDAAHHLHPFSENEALGKKGARVITRADGVYLTDSEGHEILDAMAGLWCVNIGYGREEMSQVAARQMLELPFYNTFFQTTHVPVIALAAKLAEIAPGDLNHVFFAGSGSEANDTNLRMVRTYWAQKGQPEKSHVISRKNAYHGSSVGSGSLGGMTYMHEQGGMPIPGIHHIAQPDWWAEGGDQTPEDFGLACAQELEAKILELGADKVAAFIGEPVQGAGGVVVPPSTYWPEIQRICKKYDVLLIADEVICGFGRTGNMFGSETFGIKPDIMTVAKGLSSGYAPIGGSIVSDEVAAVISACEFNHGYTYSGHPVCAAVALENLRIIEEEKILDHVRNVAAPALKAAFDKLAEHPLVGTINMSGLMASIQLAPIKGSRAPFAGEQGAVGYICRENCFAQNLVMRHVGDRMIVSPPLVITPEEIEVLATRAKAALDATYAELQEKDMLKAAS
ncbi:aspartate aminotransferase family protein [Sulfitobacter mediterraneus]|uniref:aspartate aminotransferase family protein n=1 Tax=Sulfitobacter mediterraneus TaxID=83219 RepID=UPI0019321A7A|nr:aspartate aminotransferase family protein [Sulfitobacter mediterraneus]MBM1632812.1 aspartate aminotransferase family protein [Sulfitobacter mediterraneus]MBM1641054.1 aspartate aminotransferase family protein [Sulfitobacter mediterraneus]MBM1644677.1 aspartate aminotransferase family protein [Sulfitobacter mediterraneus]MBM1649174.1 aspartate aminotransferase family protein [Sulfitobacter mediterraneus]MBM1653195.1 aspartate aminotransferase family protein [Sulfitobacter mediterraneus]